MSITILVLGFFVLFKMPTAYSPGDKVLLNTGEVAQIIEYRLKNKYYVRIVYPISLQDGTMFRNTHKNINRAIIVKKY